MVKICLLTRKRTKLTGFCTDIYLYQKYLDADVYLVGNKKIYTQGKINKEDYKFLQNYDYIILLEQTLYSHIISSNFENLRHKLKFIFMPNQEIKYLDKISDNNRYDNIDYILAKTNLIRNKYESKDNVNLNVIYTKHTSIDLKNYIIYNMLDYKNKVIHNNKFFFKIKPHNYTIENPLPTFIHLSSSGWKNTKLICKYWKSNPRLPLLTILTQDNNYIQEYKERKYSNILVITKWVTEEEKIKLLLKNLFHICFSEAEGFGHCINESRSLGRIVITRDEAPMNELIDESCGIIGKHFGRCISECLCMTQVRKNILMKNVRKRFEKDNNFFINSISNFKKSLE